MKELWKITTLSAILFGTVFLLIMTRYSATKSVVITEQHELEGEGNLEPLIQSIREERALYDFVVLINAAHGGDNQGNVVNELMEKTITLEVGSILEELSEEGEIGFFMIRQKDIDISNESRAQMIKEIQPDMVVDLHVNADVNNERTFGTSVLYNDRFYRPAITNVRMADIIERSLVTEIRGKALGVFGDSQNKYPLLSMIQVPAVSVELGYLTNKQEANLLNNEAYQQRIAEGIYKGILVIREELQ